jgi:hypothetical protein
MREMIMKKFNVMAVMAAGVLLAACGSSSTRDSTITGSGFNNSSGNTSVGNIYNLPQAPEYIAKISGPSGSYPSQSYSVGTSRTLRVKVTPLSAPNMAIAGYGSWNFAYGCAAVQVYVNGTAQMTQMLRVGSVAQSANSPCANAPTYQILNFDNAMSGGTSVSVIVTNAQYDNCRTKDPSAYGCAMKAVWTNHFVGANIAIQTDNTWLDP